MANSLLAPSPITGQVRIRRFVDRADPRHYWILDFRGRSVSDDRRGVDFPRGLHWCATKELSGHCSSSVTVVGYDLVVPHTKL